MNWWNKLLAIVITAVIASAAVIVNLQSNEQTVVPMREIPDTDRDGVPDDRDRIIRGNAGVDLSITDFRASDGCKNWLPIWNPACDPTFEIRWDKDSDGEWDGHWSKDYTDTNDIEVVFQTTIDIPDDLTRLRILIEVVDGDGGETIDYWSETYSSRGYIEISLTQGPQSVKLAGKGAVSASLIVNAIVLRIP